jgi:EamA domain-containing membrane protein RarD
MPPITYAFGAMIAFMMLGTLHKAADRAGCRPSQVNLLLFAWSTLLSFAALLAKGGSPAMPAQVWYIAIPSGICAATAILLFQIGVRHGKIATSWLIVNLSAGVPVIASLLIYGEQVSARKAVALVTMVAALVLLWLDKRQKEAAASK